MTPGMKVLLRVTDAAAVALAGAAEELCALDSVAGDGDHGLAMNTAAKAIQRDLVADPPANVASMIELLATEFGAVGGSMGALLSVMFDALGEAVVLSGSALTAADVAAYLTISNDAIADFGGAKVGDKTIVDAMAGAQIAATRCAERGASVSAALSAAAEGASAAAEGTAGMVARIGRASRLGERSRGAMDAGARSFALVLTAVAEAYEKKGEE